MSRVLGFGFWVQVDLLGSLVIGVYRFSIGIYKVSGF